MNNLQDQGRACYKRGDYRKAIEYFERAIRRAPSVQLLDNRAACYEKLNQLSTALKDAKMAIRLHREDAVGYLRAGRLLTKMQKENVALEIYTHGLKCIKHVGQGYEQLRKVHRELTDQLCPPKSVDPFTVLPRELAETVLEYLSFRQRMNACLVSKPWADFIRSIPNVWRHLDLSAARRKVRSAFISRAINTARTRLKFATLSNLYDLDKTLHALVKHCQLEQLTLLECGLQSQNLTAVLLPAKTLRSVRLMQGSQLNSHELRPLMQALADRLEVLECRVVGRQSPGDYHVHCGKLRYLSVQFDDHHDHRPFFDQITEHFPALQTLVVNQYDARYALRRPLDLQGSKHLQHLSLYTALLLDEVKLPPTLISLKLDFTFCEGVLVSALPNLQELMARSSMGFRQIELLLDAQQTTEAVVVGEQREVVTPSRLSTLAVTCSYCAGPALAKSLFLHPRLKDVAHISLARCTGVNDYVLDAIMSSKPERLRTFDLTSTEVTGVGVKQVVTTSRPDSLVLHDCRNVSPDAVEWARSQGVDVKYRMSETTVGGRKVRF